MLVKEHDRENEKNLIIFIVGLSSTIVTHFLKGYELSTTMINLWMAI